MYDNTTKQFLALSPDLTCNDAVCNHVTWTNASWNGGNVPDLTLQGAPAKDTIVVPIGGYIVTRFKANNPGIGFFLNCPFKKAT